MSNVATLGFLLIIDKNNFGEPRNEELKSCDAGSLSGESSKLSEGTVFIRL